MTKIIEAGSGKKKKKPKSIRRLCTEKYTDEFLNFEFKNGYFNIVGFSFKNLSKEAKALGRVGLILGKDFSIYSEKFLDKAYRDEIPPLDKVVGSLFDGSRYGSSQDSSFIYHWFAKIPDFPQVEVAKLILPNCYKIESEYERVTFHRSRVNSTTVYIFEGQEQDILALNIIFKKGKSKEDLNRYGLVIPLVLETDWRIKQVYNIQKDWMRPHFKKAIAHVFSMRHHPEIKEVKKKNTILVNYQGEEQQVTYFDGYFTTPGLIKGVREAINNYSIPNRGK